MNTSDQIISFYKAHRVFSHAFFWMAALLVSISADSYMQQDLFSANRFMYHGLTLVTQIISAYFLSYFIIPQLLASKNLWLVFFYFASGMYLICGFARTINIHIYEPLAGIPPKAFETMTEIFGNVERLFFVYFFRNLSVAIVFLFFKLLIDQFSIQKHALSLEKEKAETELRLLKTQLNPHFLLNTLNNIYSLSLTSSPITSPSIARLADILVHILYRCDGLFVPLTAEIKLLQNYIELEKLRYDERLQVHFNVTIDHDVEIAPLILLSIVENAFKHGAGKDIGCPVIIIELKAGSGVLFFKVANPLNIDVDNQSRDDNGRLGLQNLSRQLALIYPDRHQLKIIQTTDQYTVDLQIDLNK